MSTDRDEVAGKTVVVVGLQVDGGIRQRMRAEDAGK